MLCVVTFCQGAVISPAAPEIAPGLAQAKPNHDAHITTHDDLSVAESANPQYLGKTIALFKIKQNSNVINFFIFKRSVSVSG